MRGMTVRFFFTLGRNADGNNRRLPPKLLYYFLSLCKTFNELFHLPPPIRSGHTRPCFPKASAKVQPFNVNTKRLPIKTEKISTGLIYTLLYLKYSDVRIASFPRIPIYEIVQTYVSRVQSVTDSWNSTTASIPFRNISNGKFSLGE